MKLLSLHRIVLYLPLLLKASAASKVTECEWPAGIEKCLVCPPSNPADLTIGSGGYGIGPDGLPGFGGTGAQLPPPLNGSQGPSRAPGGQGPSPTSSGQGPSPTPGGQGCRVFSLTSTWATYAPDGNAREMFLINGQFPAPKLEINQGECVEIYYQNNSPFNTSIHFHGGSLPERSQHVSIVQADYFIQESNNFAPLGPTAYPGSLSEGFGPEKGLPTGGQRPNTVPTGITHTRHRKSMMVSSAPLSYTLPKISLHRSA